MNTLPRRYPPPNQWTIRDLQRAKFLVDYIDGFEKRDWQYSFKRSLEYNRRFWQPVVAGLGIYVVFALFRDSLDNRNFKKRIEEQKVFQSKSKQK